MARVIIKPTGVWLLPPRLAHWLGFWSAWEQRHCPHPEHRKHTPSGDERLHRPRIRWRCLECGLVAKVARR